MMDDVTIYSEPFGIVLVMGAWNYPLQVNCSSVLVQEKKFIKYRSLAFHGAIRKCYCCWQLHHFKAK